MPEQKIEDYIISELPPNDRKIALDFIGHLRSSGMEFLRDMGDCWKDKIYYWVRYKGNKAKCACFIAINDPDEKDNRWTVWSDDMGSEFLADYPIENELKEIALKHVDTCGNCGSCGGGKPKVIFGKEFDRVCGCTFRVDNPDEKDLMFLKKMIEIRKLEVLSEMQTGLTNTVTITVTHNDSAKVHGSGTLDVFATPAMIALMERTAMDSVAEYLAEDEATVGTEINVQHLSATPIGCEVTCHSELIGIDGRKLTFKVTASDSKGVIGEGTHTRFIIKTEKFLAKASEKLN